MVLDPDYLTWLPLIPPGGVSDAVTATFAGQSLAVWGWEGRGGGPLLLKYVRGL
jgi:hypothetical protein